MTNGERTEYPIHEMTKFIFCSGCQKKIRQDITEDLLEYEKQKVMEWVRKIRTSEKLCLRKNQRNMQLD